MGSTPEPAKNDAHVIIDGAPAQIHFKYHYSLWRGQLVWYRFRSPTREDNEWLQAVVVASAPDILLAPV